MHKKTFFSETYNKFIINNIYVNLFFKKKNELKGDYKKISKINIYKVKFLKSI